MAQTEIRSTQVKDLTVLVDDLRDFGPTDGGSLNLDIKAGRTRNDSTITDKSAQVVALTDNTTNFVEINTVGAATANTSAFTAGSMPIAEVVTSGGSISSITDKRAWAVTSTGPLLQSTRVTFSRTAAAGAGTVAITGVGFKPRAVIIYADGTVAGEHSRGFGGEDLTVAMFFLPGSARDTVHILQVGATNHLRATLDSFDSDGFTLTYIKAGTGSTLFADALCFR